MKQDITTLDQRLALVRIAQEEEDEEAESVRLSRIVWDYLADIAAGEFDKDNAMLKEFARKIDEVDV